MKRILLGLAVLATGSLIAQDLPQPSPTASISQKVGLTDINVNYSRPSVKGRTIFGDLVPYNELWRTGANKNTMLTFSTDVNFAGTEVKAGEYSMFTIPAKGEWTIVLNSKTDMWGTGEYSKVNDVARVNVKSQATSSTETFTINIENISADGADLVLSWEETKVSIPLKVEVQAQALKNIEAAIAEAKPENIWRVYRNAANYHYNNKIDLNKALEYMEKSIQAKDDSWYSYWVQAEIMAELNMKKEAVSSAKRAIKIGEAASKESGKPFKYAEMIESGIKSWNS